MFDIDKYLQNQDMIKALSYLAIQNSAWWDSHSSGRPVRAKGDARRVIWSEIHNEFMLPYGANGNKFIVGKAVKGVLKKFYLQLEHGNKFDQIHTILASEVTTSVANHTDDLYFDYPTRDNRGLYMEFGSHSINIHEFVMDLLQRTFLSKQ